MAAAAALTLTLAAATAAEAAEPLHQIAIVNDYGAPMVIYAEDATGDLHEVATVDPGEVRLVETAPGGAAAVAVRLHARPTNSEDRWSTWGDIGITSDMLELRDEDTAIFWIARDLAESLVEIRAK